MRERLPLFNDADGHWSLLEHSQASAPLSHGVNQYTQKDEAATFDVLGLANVSASVTVNGSSAYRRNEYFHKELTVSNGSAPVWQSVQTIASLGGSTTTNNGNMYVAKTPEIIQHDLDGNLIEDGRWLYTWDAENRKVMEETIGTVPTGAKKRLIHEYDWMGRRIRKQVYDWIASAWSLVQDERFLYDGWNVIAILDSATTIKQTQLWGSDLSGTQQGAGGVGGLLAISHYPSSKTYFAGYDGNGNVTVLIDGVSGITEGSFEYGPFGELIRASGTAAAVCPWRFSTKYEDAETGQLYYGYRFYNPSTGRWLSRDPAMELGGLNTYAFNLNNSLRFFDALGLCERLPSAERGYWTGEPGNSPFKFWDKGFCKKYPSGIPFSNCVPDYKGQPDVDEPVTIDEFSGDREKDKAAANKKMREREGADWQQPDDKDWHHYDRNGKKEMQLVPRDLHRNTAHEGPHAQIARNRARNLAKKCCKYLAGAAALANLGLLAQQTAGADQATVDSLNANIGQVRACETGGCGLGTDVENLDTDIYVDLTDIFGPLPASSAWGRSSIGR